MRPRLIVLAFTVLAACAACNRSNSPTTPTPPSSPPAAAPALSRVTIGGNTSLAAIGETSALTATAHMSDGTTANVTASARWGSTDPATIAVTSTRWRFTSR